MKNIFLFTICLIMSLNGYTQQDSARQKSGKKQEARLTPEQRAIRIYRKFRSEISMDSALSEKVREILIEREKEKEKIKNQFPEKSEKRRNGVKEAHINADKKLKAILNEAQWKKLQEVRKDLRKKQKERIKNRQKKPDMYDSEIENDEEGK